MNYKIIETNYLFPDVLIYRDRGEKGEKVIIMAIGQIEGDLDMFVSENIQFEAGESAQRFIDDYSIQSAEKWCKNNNINY